MTNNSAMTEQGALRLQQDEKASRVECLGTIFESDEARRAHYLTLLSEKLRDPAFRSTPGFPIASDDDILRLSDPPYFTACPNPWIKDILESWKRKTQGDLTAETSNRLPYAGDVSEGKYDPLYRMHPYHTKVPPKAIMRYILHYTEPGDVVFDGFCGTGMTGVAAKMCGDRNAVISLGYRVSSDGTVLRCEKDGTSEERWIPFSRLGERYAILTDLSPSASFLAWNYNESMDGGSIKTKADILIEKALEKHEWMFETIHKDGSKGIIDYVIWSDVCSCPQCGSDIVFWHTAVDVKGGKVKARFNCPSCSKDLSKRALEKKWTTILDPSTKEQVTVAKQIPVLISYSTSTGRFSKIPDQDDLNKIEAVETASIREWHPVDPLPKGVNTSQPIASHGLSKVHHFYSRRNLAVLSTYYAAATPDTLSILTAVAFRITKRYALTYQSGVWGAGGGPTNGTYYIPALVKELNIVNMMRASAKKQTEARASMARGLNRNYIISVQSAEAPIGDENCIDYIFIDPPFGANLNYSELNFMWESWLRVWTNNTSEAIENKVQKKDIDSYRQIMTCCLASAYKVLKPGKWITIEFSNTSAIVWNNIQTSLVEAGFIVANVSALDKQKGSFKALTSPTAVKQDLVISAYKPNSGFESRFAIEAGSEEGVWDFIRNHLSFLPVVKYQNHELQAIPERDPRILYDRMLSFYVRRGLSIPLSSAEFQKDLLVHFAERDEMIFLQEQAAEYDQARSRMGGIQQQSLFIFDESSAIQWIRRELKNKPQLFSDINHLYMQNIGGWSKSEVQLDLRELLNQNFLCYEGGPEVPPQITSWLRKSSSWRIEIGKEVLSSGQSLDQLGVQSFSTKNQELRDFAADHWYVPNPERQADLQRMRETSLLKQFQAYVADTKKIKVSRAEAIRAGFKDCWRRKDYGTIISVARRLNDTVLREDEQLLMYFDNAVTRFSDSL